MLVVATGLAQAPNDNEQVQPVLCHTPGANQQATGLMQP